MNDEHLKEDRNRNANMSILHFNVTGDVKYDFNVDKKRKEKHTNVIRKWETIGNTKIRSTSTYVLMEYERCRPLRELWQWSWTFEKNILPEFNKKSLSFMMELWNQKLIPKMWSLSRINALGKEKKYSQRLTLIQRYCNRIHYGQNINEHCIN